VESDFIKVEDVYLTYPDGTEALKGVSTTFGTRDFVAIIGHNGSGKTTFAKCLNGFLKPTKGEVLVEGKSTRKYTMAELGRKIGYVFQNVSYQLFADSVFNELAFGVRNMGLDERVVAQRVDETLKLVGLTKYRDSHPRRLSGGEQQRVAVGSILAMEPKAVILDEPTTGQDYMRRIDILNFCRKLNSMGKLIILISHDLSFIAAYCDRAIVLDGGKIVADGPVRETLGNIELMERVKIKPPQITQLAVRLKDCNVPCNILTVEDMERELLRKMGGS